MRLLSQLLDMSNVNLAAGNFPSPFLAISLSGLKSSPTR